MISRKTGVELLLALLLASGMAMWNARHPDLCYQYMHGDQTVPSSQGIEVSGKTVYVPCDQWYPRQTMAIQTLCLVEAGLIVLFLVSAIGDFVDWRRRRLQ
jgi:hypothetical protein